MTLLDLPFFTVMAKRPLPATSNSSLELMPRELLRNLVTQYCCDAKHGDESFSLLCTLRALSRTMRERMLATFHRARCGSCRVLIQPQVQFYMLGGGRVPTCVPCACDRPFTIVINRKPATFRRGWDVPAEGSKWLKLQRQEQLYALCLY